MNKQNHTQGRQVVKSLVEMSVEDHTAAKVAAARKQVSLKDFILDAIREKTAREERNAA